jgi:quercetin dioxygenase-like cupin family protein
MPSSISSERVGHLVDPSRIEVIGVLGPTIQFLTPPDETNAPCIMRGTIPAGVSVPLHSHADPETFVMISGSVEGLVYPGSDAEHTWVRLEPGDIFHVPGHAKHAWRNRASEPAVMLLISTSKIGRFFKELGTPARAGGRIHRPRHRTSGAFSRRPSDTDTGTRRRRRTRASASTYRPRERRNEPYWGGSGSTVRLRKCASVPGPSHSATLPFACAPVFTSLTISVGCSWPWT